MKRRPFQESDKVVLMEPIISVELFRPVPEPGRVYCVRQADPPPEPGLRLVGIQGVYEDGEEVWLVADKFCLLSVLQGKGAR